MKTQKTLFAKMWERKKIVFLTSLSLLNLALLHLLGLHLPQLESFSTLGQLLCQLLSSFSAQSQAETWHVQFCCKEASFLLFTWS